MKFFRLPFASKLQIVLLVGIVTGFVLVAQNQSADVYRYGLILLMGSALLQVVAGNIPPEANLISTLVRLAVGLAIIAAVFGIGIWLVPILARIAANPNGS
ncbi:MAG TPA: hypothetical protein VGD78_18665 [Chthoniobacterales bacterium]